MSKNNLLASVALFSELYNSDSYKSIPDILAEFIKGAIILEKKYSFNSTELKDLMTKVYGFSIPESVLRTVLHNKLKDSVKIKNKIFYLEPKAINLEIKNIDKNVEKINEEQNKIISDLYNFIEKKTSEKLTELEKEKIFNTFSHILMDNGYSNKYSDIISTFIISNEKNESFTTTLNIIKEGLILYQGAMYTANINELGNWNDNLTIYLSTEHLFNCIGYNGILLQEIFEDFYKLVIEINHSPKNKKKKRPVIELKYLTETRTEVDNFFITAESILRGNRVLDPSKGEAMSMILKGSKSVSEIKRKQVEFYSCLKSKGIEYQSTNFDIENGKFNVVDNTIIEELQQLAKDKNRTFDENYCINMLRIFTKVNTFRHGKNKVPFENIGHIYITENGFTKYLAHNEKVKFNKEDIPFAKDIDFIISKFWFKLKKGFNNKNDLPKSFDVVNKAKIILSSHINSSVSKNYEILHKEFNDGKLTEEQALELRVNFSDKSGTPEDITFENAEKSLDFLNDDNVIENFIREKTKRENIHKDLINKNKELEKELSEIRIKEKNELERKEKKKLEDEKEKYIDDKWLLHKKTKDREFLYLISISILTIVPISIGVLLKTIPKLKIWMNSIDSNLQYSIWGILTMIFLIETLGRSYIFNKEKTKNGWKWFLVKINKKNYKLYKNEKIDEFHKEFLDQAYYKSIS